jgi:hypothetical protein
MLAGELYLAADEELRSERQRARRRQRCCQRYPRKRRSGGESLPSHPTTSLMWYYQHTGPIHSQGLDLRSRF